jgi:hypothetical protein
MVRETHQTEFRILGPLEVVEGDDALDLGGPKQRALLALLVLEASPSCRRPSAATAWWRSGPGICCGPVRTRSTFVASSG